MAGHCWNARRDKRSPPLHGSTCVLMGKHQPIQGRVQMMVLQLGCQERLFQYSYILECIKIGILQTYQTILQDKFSDIPYLGYSDVQNPLFSQQQMELQRMWLIASQFNRLQFAPKIVSKHIVKTLYAFIADTFRTFGSNLPSIRKAELYSVSQS